MAITIAEFKSAMEVFGAQRQPDQISQRFHSTVPCFSVKGIEFIHSGLSYVIQGHNKVPEEIMNRAMAALGEEPSGGDNYYEGEVYSVRGMLTLAAMLEDKYSCQLIDELTNITYHRLLEDPIIQHLCTSESLHVTQELREALQRYDSVVNPFVKGLYQLREPSDFVDRINLSIDFEDEDTQAVHLALDEKRLQKVRLGYRSEPNDWSYSSLVRTEENGNTIEIMLNHSYDTETQPAYEYVYAYRTVNKRVVECLLNDRDYEFLDINLTTGTVKNEMDQPVTSEQVQRMISFIEISIREAQQEIICHITDG